MWKDKTGTSITPLEEMKILIQEACLETDKIDFEQATRFINAFNKIKSHEKEWA